MSRREFPKSIKLAAWQRCGGFCEAPGCGLKLYIGKFRYDHDTPDAFGGEPTLANCIVRCNACDKDKTYKQDIPAIAKSNRVRAKHLGLKESRHPMPGGKESRWKRKINGRVERR